MSFGSDKAAVFLDIALTCIFGWHCEVCLQTVISGSVPGKSAVISIPESGLFIGLRAWRSWAPDTDFFICRLCTVITRDSQKHLMILCTVYSQFYIEEHADWWTAHLCFWETASPRCSFYPHSCYWLATSFFYYHLLFQPFVEMVHFLCLNI